jgi:hypothetical protein
MATCRLTPAGPHATDEPEERASSPPLYTRNPGDFRGLEHLLDIVTV